MKIKDLSKEELETMSYDDIAYLILSESGTKIKITDLFKEICNLLGLSQAEYESKITDFFSVLSTDQRFIMLEKGYWDLKSKHQTKVIIEEDEEDEEIEEENIEDEIPEEDDDIFYDGEETDDTTDDDLKDLVIVDENEEDNASM